MAGPSNTISLQELFKNIVLFPFQDSTLMQQDKKAKEHHAAAICTTFLQLSSVAQCVINTVLRHRLMEASEHTQVVEH